MTASSHVFCPWWRIWFKLLWINMCVLLASAFKSKEWNSLSFRSLRFVSLFPKLGVKVFFQVTVLALPLHTASPRYTFLPSRGFVHVVLILEVPCGWEGAPSAKEQYVGIVQVAFIRRRRSSNRGGGSSGRAPRCGTKANKWAQRLKWRSTGGAGRPGDVHPPALVSPPVLPDRPEAGVEDERCPLTTGCDRAGGQCVCDARHSCLGSFSYPDLEACTKASKSGEVTREAPSDDACGQASGFPLTWCLMDDSVCVDFRESKARAPGQTQGEVRGTIQPSLHVLRLQPDVRGLCVRVSELPPPLRLRQPQPVPGSSR